MASTTLTAPATHSAVESTWGHSYQFAPTLLDAAMADELDLLGMPLVRLVGDFAGTGTDTMRVRYIDGVGFEKTFTAMGSETDRVAPSAATLGYSEVSLGMYGLGFSDTYKAQLLSLHGEELVDYLLTTVPASYVATMRYQFCVAGATYGGTAIGSNTAPLTIDDWLDLAAARRTTTGAVTKGRLGVTLGGIQVNQLVESARQEPAFQSSAAQFQANSKASDSALHPDLFGLGMDVAETNDVIVSSSARQGFASSPGAMGYCVGNTARIKVAGKDPIYIPNRGLVIETLTDGAGQSVREVSAKLFTGVAISDSNAFFQRLVRSQNS